MMMLYQAKYIRFIAHHIIDDTVCSIILIDIVELKSGCRDPQKVGGFGECPVPTVVFGGGYRSCSHNAMRRYRSPYCTGMDGSSAISNHQVSSIVGQ